MNVKKLFKTLVLAFLCSPVFAQLETKLNGTDLVGTWQLDSSFIKCPQMQAVAKPGTQPTLVKFYANGQMECNQPRDMFFGGWVKWWTEQNGTWITMIKNPEVGTGFGPETNANGDMVFNMTQFTDSCGYVPAVHIYRKVGGIDYVPPVAPNTFVVNPNDPIFEQNQVDSMAVFGRGESSAARYNSLNIQYPAAAREAGLQGQVLVEFIVEKDGSLSNFLVKKDIGGGCGEEALRILKTMPKWRVAKKSGEPVRVRVSYPVAFKLG